MRVAPCEKFATRSTRSSRAAAPPVAHAKPFPSHTQNPSRRTRKTLPVAHAKPFLFFSMQFGGVSSPCPPPPARIVFDDSGTADFSRNDLKRELAVRHTPSALGPHSVPLYATGSLSTHPSPPVAFSHSDPRLHGRDRYVFDSTSSHIKRRVLHQSLMPPGQGSCCLCGQKPRQSRCLRKAAPGESAPLHYSPPDVRPKH